MFKSVNWIALVVSVVALEVVGFLWYAVIFATAWTAALGAPMDPKPVAVAQTIGLVNTVITVFGLDWLLRKLNASSLQASIVTALTAWVFFDFTTMVIDYGFVGHTATLVIINMGYQLVAYGLAGAIFGLIKPRSAAA